MIRTVKWAATTAALSLGLAIPLAYAPAAAALPPTVNGSPDKAQAAKLPVGTIDNPGEAMDVLPPEMQNTDDRWFLLKRSSPDATLLVGAAAIPPNMHTLSFRAAAETTEEKYNSCVILSGMYAGKQGRPLLASGANAMDRCPAQTESVLSLSRDTAEGHTAAGDRVPVLLRAVEVPKVTNLADLPTSLPKRERTPIPYSGQVDIVGGRSVTEPAPAPQRKQIKLQLKTDEPQFFTVDVGWGQSLAISLETMRPADIPVDPQAFITTEKTPIVTLDAYGPTLNRLLNEDIIVSSQRLSTIQVANPVVWRSYNGTNGYDGPAYLAGKHLIAVGAPQQGYGKPTTVSATMTIEVTGEVTGVPQFATAKTETAAPTGLSATKKAAIGLGVTGVVMLVAAGIIASRTRA